MLRDGMRDRLGLGLEDGVGLKRTDRIELVVPVERLVGLGLILMKAGGAATTSIDLGLSSHSFNSLMALLLRNSGFTSMQDEHSAQDRARSSSGGAGHKF